MRFLPVPTLIAKCAAISGLLHLLWMSIPLTSTINITFTMVLQSLFISYSPTPNG